MNTEWLKDFRSWETGVGITIGNGLGFASREHADHHPKLVLETAMTFDKQAVDLGPFTAKRIDELCEYLQRLKIHAK